MNRMRMRYGFAINTCAARGLREMLKAYSPTRTKEWETEIAMKTTDERIREMHHLIQTISQSVVKTVE